MSKPNILITGSNGALGKKYKQLLERHGEYNIVCYSDDITCSAQVESFFKLASNIDVVIHLAAKVPVKEVEENKYHAIYVNSTGTCFVATAAAVYFPKCHFIYVSSSHVYSPTDNKLDETAELGPISFYGLTKLLGEDMVRRVSHFYGMKFSIVRVFSMWDEEQSDTFLYGNLKRRLSNHTRGEPFELYGANSLRNFSHTSEVAEFLLEVMKHGPIGEINVGSDTDMLVADFAQKMYGEKLDIVPVGANNNLVPNLDKFANLRGKDEV